MELKSRFFKRRYYDLRIGGVTINPLIQAANFVMIVYLTLRLADIVPLGLFVPMFLMGVVSVFTAVGFYFRKIQLSTDEDMKYEKQVDFNKTLLVIMKALENPEFTNTLQFKERLQYVKELSENKII